MFVTAKKKTILIHVPEYSSMSNYDRIDLQPSLMIRCRLGFRYWPRYACSYRCETKIAHLTLS